MLPNIISRTTVTKQPMMICMIFDWDKPENRSAGHKDKLEIV
jgi:hypothetical protein